jgi:hypothetical protein
MPYLLVYNPMEECMHLMTKSFTRSIVFSFLLFILLACMASADNQVELNLMGAFPQGEFKQQINAGGGIAGGYTYGFFSDRALSLRLGVDGGFIIYGNESRTELFSTTIPDVRVRVETSNNIVHYGLVGRVSTTFGAIQPYIEGKAGMSYFYTETRIKDIDRTDDQEIASSKNFDDTSTYTALGGGCLIPVYTRAEKGKFNFRVNVDLRFLYWWGGETDYLKEGSIKRENGNVIYDVTRSKTDMTSVHLGVAMNF